MEQITKISVMGAGQMGHQIAMLCALGGLETTLYDLDEGQLLKAEEALNTLMNQWVQKGKINEEEKGQAFSKLSFTHDFERAAASPDLVIEAVVEKLSVKKELFQALERKVPSHTIFATNSSTIVNSLLATVTQRPDKFVNMHFFFPPLVMNCVEVVMSRRHLRKQPKLPWRYASKLIVVHFYCAKKFQGSSLIGSLERFIRKRCIFMKKELQIFRTLIKFAELPSAIR